MRTVLLLFLVAIALAEINPQRFKWGTYKPQLIHAITERNIHTFNPLTVTFYYFMNERVDWEKSVKYKVSEGTSSSPPSH
jgi:mannosyl-oligosaccharide glucosidase